MSPNSPPRHPVTDEVLALFRERGGSQYGKEAVTQLEHALQAATFAERDGAAPALVAAALLHDVGHLLHDLPDDAPDKGVDDRHEGLAAAWLKPRFGPDVVVPVALHVDAKRYLCAVDPAYFGILSAPSVQSLALQGGPMSPEEVARFESRPFFQDAVRSAAGTTRPKSWAWRRPAWTTSPATSTRPSARNPAGGPGNRPLAQRRW
ncbi:MAG: metal-dependent phosphohydrolase [Isosphaeraceae bacterium]